jgi:hypothetical protein
MRRIGLLATFVVAVAAAHAQAQAPDTAVPSPATESRVEPARVLEDAVPPRLEQSPSRPRSDVDARHCLDLATNAQVHRCAEPFRTRPSQARAKPAIAGK